MGVYVEWDCMTIYKENMYASSLLEIKEACVLVCSKYFDEGNSLVNLLVARNRKEHLGIHSCCLFLLQQPADAAIPEK